MAPGIYNDTTQSKSLEVIYVQCARKNDLLFQEEEARQLRLRILLLEDENDDLHDQLAQEDDRADTLEKEKEELQERVNEALQDLKLAQAEVRTKGRELDSVKAELSSLNTISTSSSKLLSEKLALSHELSTIRPELEHLRSQAASYQSLISEKLSLQRQLNTIQVELETERRASQRAITKEGKENAQDLKLQSQVDSLRQELSKEKRARERAEKEAKKGTDDWESKRAVLESKLEATKGKLRAAKDQLKEKETEVQQAQAAAARAVSAQSQHDATNTATKTKNSRKRTNALSIDDTIGTPGGAIAKGRRAGKRDTKTATLPGDKSTFSMTPFLNRTASIAPESPPQQQNEGESIEGGRGGEREEGVAHESEVDPDEAVQEASSPKAPERKTAKRNPKPQAQPSKEKALNAAKAGKSNVLGKRSTAPALEKVIEEENNENIPPVKAGAATKPTQKDTTTFSTIIDEPEPKRKKRKILGGKTLFDDEDADKEKPAKSLFGGAKAFAGLSKGGLAGPRRGVVTGGFGEISPLKKDKKNAR